MKENLFKKSLIGLILLVAFNFTEAKDSEENTSKFCCFFDNRNPT